MRTTIRFATLVIAIGLGVATAAAAPLKPPSHPGQPQKGPSGTTGAQPTASSTPSSQAKAYGFYCQSQSKKHVAGQKGTPFSQCVTAMAKLATGKTKSPEAACTSMSKTHTAGEKGTPFSRCVAAGAKLLKSKHQ